MIFEITFTPVFRPDTNISLSRIGSVLTINGSSIDFSVLEDGDDLPADIADGLHDLVAYQAIERVGGTVSLTLAQPYCRTEPWTGPALIVDNDGPVSLPFPVEESGATNEPSSVSIPLEGIRRAEAKALEEINRAWNDLRSERDRRLDDTDKLMRRHAEELALGLNTTLTPEQHTDLLTYRQALRDLPENTTDPADPVWPVNPVE